MAKSNGKADMSNKTPPFNPHQEAEVFVDGGHFIFIYEAIHQYENGYYHFIDDRNLMDRLAVQLDTKRDQSRLGKVREVLETAKKHFVHTKNQPEFGPHRHQCPKWASGY